MATKVFLKNTTANAITDTGDGILYDLNTTAGSSVDTAVTNTAASGTEIQLTKTAGGSTVAWISGRAPVGGFTLTTTDISVWCVESNMSANVGGRFRVFKRTAAGSVSELGGGPFNDGVEFGTADTEMLWVGNVTDTAFSEDDRILIRLYLTNVGTMASGYTCTVKWNAADAATGDSFFNIAETVSFKSDTTTTNKALDVTAVAVLAFSKIMTYVKTFAVTATGALSLTRVITFVNTLAVTATVALSFTKIMTAVRDMTVSAVGLPTLTRITTFFRDLSVTAAGTSTLSKIPIYVLELSVTAVVQPLMELFIRLTRLPQNYQAPRVGDGMSTSERIR